VERPRLFERTCWLPNSREPVGLPAQAGRTCLKLPPHASHKGQQTRKSKGFRATASFAAASAVSCPHVRLPAQVQSQLAYALPRAHGVKSCKRAAWELRGQRTLTALVPIEIVPAPSSRQDGSCILLSAENGAHDRRQYKRRRVWCSGSKPNSGSA